MALGLKKNGEEVPEQPAQVLEILSSNVETYYVWSYCGKPVAVGMGLVHQPIDAREIECVCGLLEVEFEPWLVAKVRHLHSAYTNAVAKRKK